MSLKKALYKIGIDIKFVTKETITDAIAYNNAENVEKFWSDPENKKVWDSKEYKTYYYLIFDLIQKLKLNPDNKKVADMGCGSGTLLEILKEKFTNLQIYGFDITQSAIDIASQKISDGNFSKFSIYDLPAEDEKYDFIFCTEVLEHLVNPEIALENLLKRMDLDSFLIITVPNGRVDTWGGHINFWSPESWNAFISKNSQSKNFTTGILSKTALYAVIGRNLNL